MSSRAILSLVSVILLILVLPCPGAEIHRAVEAGDAAVVARILAEDPGAVNLRDDNQFRELPIHFVARTGNVEIARLLAEAGADIDAGDSDNSTALGIAAMWRQGDMVAWLIDRGADVNHRDRKADCPLSFAAYGRDEGIVQQLLAAGADLYFRNPAGETLLHVAASRGLRGLTERLLEHRADLEARAENGGTPLVYATMGGQTELVELLLAAGANANPAGPGEASALTMAAWRNRLDAARILIEHGADPNHIAHGGNSLLMEAAQGASAQMVELLIEQGADPNHRNEAGETALVKAAAGGHVDRMTALLTAGAQPDLGTDPQGRTALHLAAMGGYLGAVEGLLVSGADPAQRTPAGESALDLALYYGHGDVGASIRKHGGESGQLAAAGRSLEDLGAVATGEAVIWFLGHSGWAVKTANHLLIFDYFVQGDRPAYAGLCNGNIDPREIAGEKVSVFASHEHGDHFDAAIFDWREAVDDIDFFLGVQPEEAPPYEFMPPRLEKDFGDMRLTTIRSTDAGVGMVVEVDGLCIFHPGDHANGRPGLMDAFTSEIDFLAAAGLSPDIAFMGIRGCSLGQPDEVAEGVRYALRTLGPKVFIPMHSGTDGHHYWDFIAGCRDEFPGIRMIAADNRGDHFAYSDGRIQDPKGSDYRRAQASAAAGTPCPTRTIGSGGQ